MVISHMVMKPAISKACPVYILSQNMYNTNVLGEYNTCQLFHLVKQFCELYNTIQYNTIYLFSIKHITMFIAYTLTYILM